MKGGDGGGFFGGEPLGVGARRFGFARAFVEIGGHDFIGREPETREQGDAARAGRGEDEWGCG
jgi:hypothetical protein